MIAQQIQILIQVRSETEQLLRIVDGFKQLQAVAENVKRGISSAAESTDIFGARVTAISKQAGLEGVSRTPAAHELTPFPRGFSPKLPDQGSSLLGIFDGLESIFKHPLARLGLAVTKQIGEGIATGVRQNIVLEDEGTAFQPLLRSSYAVGLRMRELASLVDSTKFELPHVVEASKNLQSLAGDALAAGRGFRLVGDAAGATGQPIQDVAVQIGHVYAGLKNGTPITEATRRLAEMKIVSLQESQHLNSLAASGVGATKAYQELTGVLGRFEGVAQQQSRTLGGMWETLKKQGTAMLGGVTSDFSGLIRSDLERFLTAIGSIEDRTVVEARERLRKLRAVRDAEMDRQRESATAAAAVVERRARTDGEFDVLKKQKWDDTNSRIARLRLEDDGRRTRVAFENNEISVDDYQKVRRAQIEEGVRLEIAAATRVAEDNARLDRDSKNPEEASDYRIRILEVSTATAEIRAAAETKLHQLDEEIERSRQIRGKVTASEVGPASQSSPNETRQNSITDDKSKTGLPVPSDGKSRRQDALNEQNRILENATTSIAEERRQLSLRFDLTEAERRKAREKLTEAEIRITKNYIGILDGFKSAAPEAEKPSYDTHINSKTVQLKKLDTDRNYPGPDPGSSIEMFQKRWTDLRGQLDVFADDFAKLLMSPISAFRDGLSSSLNQLLEKGATAGEFFGGLAKGIGTSMRKAFADMVSNWITTHVIMKGVALAWNAFATMLKWKEVGTENAAEKAKLPLKIQNATWASIGSFGVAAAIGVAAIAGILASMGAFAEGGLTPGKPTLAWVGEEGPELVIPAPATARFSAEQRAMLLEGKLPVLPGEARREAQAPASVEESARRVTALIAFAEGGLTPGTRTLAWVGERGPELVLPADVTARFSPRQQAMLLDGRLPAVAIPGDSNSSADGSRAPRTARQNHYHYWDRAQMIADSRDDISAIVHDVLRSRA
jgi:hypothetical protein